MLDDSFDLIIYLTEESGLAAQEVNEQLCWLFPALSAKGPYPLNKHVDDSFLTSYAYNRSLGLSVRDTAYACDKSYTLLKKLLAGEGIEPLRFVALVKAEIQAYAKGKQTALMTLYDHAGRDVKSAVSFLEKAYSRDYGSKAIADDVKELLATASEKWTVEVTHVDKTDLDNDEDNDN